MTGPAASAARRRFSRASRLTIAWGVHALTASGAVVGAVALLAIAEGDLRRAALLMLIALSIDSIDGTIARAAQVEHVLPRVNGRRLDDMVDYFNFVIVPAVFLMVSGNLLHWGWAAVPILASAFGFAQDDAKTEDDFFLGFPSYWNVVALYLWLLDVDAGTGTAILVALSVAVFIPIKYVYPSKLQVLARFTNGFAALWGLALLFALLAPERAAAFRVVELSLAFPAYYLGLSFWLGGLRRRRA